MSRIFDAMQRSEDVGPSHVLSVRERALASPAAIPDLPRETAALASVEGGEWGRELFLAPPPDSRLVSLVDSSGLGAEQFRLLAVRLSNLQVQRNYKRILVASSVSGEGKTLVAANLALTLSRTQGKRVLVIEGDLRRPALRNCLGFGNIRGLTQLLGSHDPARGFIHPVNGMPLWYLSAGTPTDEPSAVLNSRELSDLLDDVADSFDYIIVDSAPILPLADANLWLRLVHGMLLVVRQGKTPKTALTQALPMLDNPTMIGVIFNGAEEVLPHYGKYYKSYTSSKRRPSGEPS